MNIDIKFKDINQLQSDECHAQEFTIEFKEIGKIQTNINNVDDTP